MILKLLKRENEEMKCNVSSTMVKQTLNSTNINCVEMFVSNHHVTVYKIIMNHFPINLLGRFILDTKKGNYKWESNDKLHIAKSII